MHKIPEFPALLALIEERSAAFRAALADAPDLDVPVPTCPGWSLLDLARHLGGGHRRWAGVVVAGPDGGVPALTSNEIGESGPAELEALLVWFAEGTRELLAALREAGPDRACWTWWGFSESPETTGALARRLAHDVTVHTYDAQIAGGAPRALPVEAAVDGVEEFNVTCGTTKVPWPYEPAFVDVHAAEGPSWRVTLNGAGSSVSRLADADVDAGPVADVSLRGGASDLALALYGRIPVETVEIVGDRKVLDLLMNWDMEP